MLAASNSPVRCGGFSSAAETPPHLATRGLVEVEMVGVGRIVVGREGGRKQLACAVANLAEEGGAPWIAIPVVPDCDAFAALEPETGDVDCVRGGVFAPLADAATVEPATSSKAFCPRR
jgi:hypothetical protein